MYVVSRIDTVIRTPGIRGLQLPAPSGAPIAHISQDEFDRLRQYEFYQTGHSLTHPSSSGMNAYIVSLTDFEY